MEKRPLFAAVAARQDGDPPAFFAQRPGEHLDHRGFAGSAAGKVADADHQATERVIADHPFVVHPDPELYRHPVETRGDEQDIG
ncbi:hypothetical protein SDC9_123127 [bioreactor metagenome]|uniref:Uncharacterized protein n=1 Tax=bioreactor metagenome TaxID=1076179 RepID=A0A645CGY2_9ZZZZ